MMVMSSWTKTAHKEGWFADSGADEKSLTLDVVVVFRCSWYQFEVLLLEGRGARTLVIWISVILSE